MVRLQHDFPAWRPAETAARGPQRGARPLLELTGTWQPSFDRWHSFLALVAAHGAGVAEGVRSADLPLHLVYELKVDGQNAEKMI